MRDIPSYPTTPPASEAEFRRRVAVLEAAKVQYLLLDFQATCGPNPRRTYATLGAAQAPGEYEVFLEVEECLSQRLDLIVALNRRAPFVPGALFPIRPDLMPFVSLLVAPAAVGCVSLGSHKGVARQALRLIPLTRAEHRLAGRSLDDLIKRLRAGGALGPVDPFRSCVVAPMDTEVHWAYHRGPLLESLEEKRDSRRTQLNQLIAEGGPFFLCENGEQLLRCSEAALATLTAHPFDSSTSAERSASRYADGMPLILGEYIQDDDLISKMSVPEPLRLACEGVVVSALVTHPAGERLIRRVQGRPEPDGVDPDLLLIAAASILCRCYPSADTATLLRIGRERLGGTQPFSDSHWRRSLAAMFHSVMDASGGRSAAATAVEGGLIDAHLFLEREKGEDPARLLEAAACSIAKRMVLVWGRLHRIAERTAAGIPLLRAIDMEKEPEPERPVRKPTRYLN